MAEETQKVDVRPRLLEIAEGKTIVCVRTNWSIRVMISLYSSCFLVKCADSYLSSPRQSSTQDWAIDPFDYPTVEMRVQIKCKSFRFCCQ